MTLVYIAIISLTEVSSARGEKDLQPPGKSSFHTISQSNRFSHLSLSTLARALKAILRFGVLSWFFCVLFLPRLCLVPVTRDLSSGRAGERDKIG